MVPEGHGDSESRDGTTLESITEGGNTQTLGGMPELSVGGGEANERPRDPGSAWAQAQCLRWIVGATVCKTLSCAITSSGQVSLVARVRSQSSLGA